MLELYVKVKFNPIQIVVIILRIAACTNEDIRLGDGAVLRGRVEVCINGRWGIICDHHWTQQEASVVCSHLGYSPYGIVYSSCIHYNFNLS